MPRTPRLPAPPVPGTPDARDQEQVALLRASLVTVRHFFGGFQALFQRVADPRHPAYVVYPLEAVLAAGVWLFLLRLAARRQVHLLLRSSGPASGTFGALFGVPTWPHGDTIEALCARLEVAEVQEAVTTTVERLIRKKVLYRYRLRDRYFLVAVDGTGVLTFPKRHCPYCLTRERNGQITYYHPVLEAKVVTRDGLVLSLMTEFVENPDQYPSKQDCELKAFYRLATHLKERLPHLPICLLLDGLFAGGPTFSLCQRFGWKYLVVLQEKDLPSVHEEFQALLKLSSANHLTFRPAEAYRTVQDFAWVNDITYPDSEGRPHTVSVIRCLESKPSAEGEQVTRFKWITNFGVTPNDVIELANEGGRLRWKIENEGFNVQKNGGYALEHIYSHDPVSAKVYYLLLQLAHTLAQLIEHGSLFRKAFPAGVGSAKNLAWLLLEAWRNLHLSAQHIQHMLRARVQIRLQPP